MVIVHIYNSGIQPRSLALQAEFLSSEPPGNPKNTGMGSLSFPQQIFLTSESNQGLLHCRYSLSAKLPGKTSIIYIYYIYIYIYKYIYKYIYLYIYIYI